MELGLTIHLNVKSIYHEKLNSNATYGVFGQLYLSEGRY